MSQLPRPHPPQPAPVLSGEGVEAVAREFHESYEDFAVGAGWKTQDASSVPWEQIPEANRQTMLATVGDLLARNVIAIPSQPVLGEREAVTVRLSREEADRALVVPGSDAVAVGLRAKLRTALSDQEADRG